MQNAFSHMGVTARISVDAAAGIIIAQSLGTEPEIRVAAGSVAELREAFAAAVEAQLSDRRQIARSYSGRLLLRLDPELHRRAALAAGLRGESLNHWLVRQVEIATDLALNDD